MPASEQFDLCVIGGGSGGVRAARLSAQKGKKVVLIEKSYLGGTCVIRGCVPKKLMVYASAFSDLFKLSNDYGWDVGETQFNWHKLRDSIQKEVMRLSDLYEGRLSDCGVNIIRGAAKFIDERTVLVGDRKIIADNIIIAVGGEPVKPAVTGIEHAIVSDDIFTLSKLPKSIAIVGVGYIGLEFACLLQRLGVQVKVIHRSDILLKGFDADLQASIRENLIASGIELVLNTTIKSINKNQQNEIELETSGGVINVEQVFYAIGRKAVAAELDCVAAGIELTSSGNIQVDANSKTSVDNIYAIGDVTGRKSLTPVAIREAVNLVDHLYDGGAKTIDYSIIPTAVFTQMEMGTVGMSEVEAAKQFDISVYLAKFKQMKFSMANHSENSYFEQKAMLKLIVEKSSEKILGAHIACEGAGEIVQLLGVLIANNATKADFDRTIAVHPTTTEELVTMDKPVR